MSIMTMLTGGMPVGAAAAPAVSHVAQPVSPAMVTLGLSSSADTTTATPAATAGADQAVAGAEAVQPPSTGKIVLSSVVKGMFTGISFLFGFNSLAKLSLSLGTKLPWIAKWVPFVGKLVSKIPFIGKLAFNKGIGAYFPMALLGVLAGGALLGGVFGLLSGFKKAKKAQADFAAAQQQQAAPAPTPVGDPLVTGANGQPIPIDPATNIPAPPPPAAASKATKAKAAAAKAKRKRAAKASHNPVMGPNYRGTSTAAASAARRRRKLHMDGPGTAYHIEHGDTLWAISHRYHTSIDAIVRANADKISNPNLIYAGDDIRIPGAG